MPPKILMPAAVSGRNGWVWVSWWRSTHQARRVAGSTPSSGSVAEPLKVTVSPPWKIVPSTGLVMTAAGAWLAHSLVAEAGGSIQLSDPSAETLLIGAALPHQE